MPDKIINSINERRRILNYSYSIVMYTPLGPRHGHLHMEISANSIDGYIDILGSRGEFNGELITSNICHLNGYINTIVRTINFAGDGSFDSRQINLKLTGQRHTYTIIGNASKASRYKEL